MSDEAAPTVDGSSAPVAGWASGPLGLVQAADREIARQTALRARAVAGFAATRPASMDRQPGQPGAMSAERRAVRPDVLADVSEWAAQELVVALCVSAQAAEQLLTRSRTLVHRLPRTLDALERGDLHPGHLWPLLEKVAPIADPEKRAAVERELLEWMAGRVTTPAQLEAKARRLGLARDARDEAARLAASLRERGVSVRSDRREGMAVLDALLTVPEAQALLDALGRYADALDDPEDQRTRGQKMADCLLDLVLRPGGNGLPPVQAQLTVVAGVRALMGGDQPGEIGADPVSAAMVRALAGALGLLPDPDPGPADSTHGPVDEWSPDTWPDAWRAADERWWAEVEARALRGEWGGEDDPPDDELARWWDQGPPRGEDGAPLPAPAGPGRSAGRADPDLGAALAPEPDAVIGMGPALDPEAERGSGQVPDIVASPASAPVAEPAAWTTARRALDAATAGVLELDRALSHARRTVADAQRADEHDEATWQRSTGGRVTAAATDLEALLAVGRSQREALAALLDASAGGTLIDRPRIAVVDELTGALLALTDSTDLRRRAAAGLGLGAPGPTHGYRPGRALDRFVRARDRRCRFPGCRRRVPLGGELDHDRPYPEGPTAAENLTGYCTGHHRGKHQAPGWQHELAPDGTLTVTTPSGLVAATVPPPY